MRKLLILGLLLIFGQAGVVQKIEAQKRGARRTVAVQKEIQSGVASGKAGKTAAQKADSVLALMTLREKIGQMNQFSGIEYNTGPWQKDTSLFRQLSSGELGSILNVSGAEKTRYYQEAAMRSRMRIPIMIGLDVIHGMKTIFPIPLAEAASFDLEAIRRSAACAAEEAAACGVHWTFAPMADVGRDARWGRVMEGAGEDPYYGALVAAARVKGFQGDDLSAPNTVLACAKHFAGYGASQAGRDYNNVDMSMCEFYNFYLPPYKAAAEAGAGTFMNAFNDLNCVPCTGNEFLLRKILKGDWNFGGFVVSDWCSVAEMIQHRYAKDAKDAARLAVTAGCDMDMVSRCYVSSLEELVKEGVVDEKLIDDAVRRILIKKFELGLFDDPYRYCNQEREKNVPLRADIRQAAREGARKSIVLLKNEHEALPFTSKVKSVALIGPLNRSKSDMLGSWCAEGRPDPVVTVEEGLKARGLKVRYSEGYDLKTNEPVNTADAVAAARECDIVVVAVGERGGDSGEARSRGRLDLPDAQQELVRALKATGKPVVTLVMGGRPLIFNDIRETSDAILMCWWLGTEAGNAIADVLAGDYNPSGKLPMTFPAHIAQIPIYYNYKSTGRPYIPGSPYTTGYTDIPFEPAYPFGYGLSYTTFAYSDLQVEEDMFRIGEPVKVTVTVTNTGDRAGEEVVQLYLRDEFASITRPVRELKGFRKIMLESGESQQVTFTLTPAELGFYNTALKWTVEPGDFTVMVGGGDSEKRLQAGFRMTD